MWRSSDNKRQQTPAHQSRGEGLAYPKVGDVGAASLGQAREPRPEGDQVQVRTDRRNSFSLLLWWVLPCGVCTSHSISDEITPSFNVSLRLWL